MTPNANLAGAVLGRLAGLGVRDYVVCAGARNVPLVSSLLTRCQDLNLRVWHHFDERAAGFDDALVAALRQADPAGLTALDPDLGTALLAQGRAPLQVLAGAMGAHVGDGERDENSGHWLCESLEQSDPFGVLYVVARLTRR